LSIQRERTKTKMKTKTTMHLVLLLAAALGLAACASPKATRSATTEPTTKETAPSVMTVTLSNGITLLHRRSASNDIVAMALLSGPGASADGEAKAGRAALAMRLLSKGTKSRTSDQIAEALEGMGAHMSPSSSHDSVSVSLQCVRGDFSPAMEIVADAWLNPTFPLEEIRTEKKRILAEIRMRDDRPSGAAMKRLRRELFSPSPYGRPVEGEPETVEALTQIDLMEAHGVFARPENMVVAIVGNVSLDEARAEVEKRFGAMKSEPKPAADASKTFSPRASLEQIVRDVEQGFIVSGYVSCNIAHEDAAAVDVLTAILGQGMSSRFFVRLRDEKGLAYSTGCMAGNMRNAGYVAAYIGTQPDRLCESIDGMAKELALIREEPATPDELARAKAYIVGEYLRDHETNGQQASHLAYWQFVGLGAEYDSKYPDAVRAVTTRDVMRVANRYLTDATTVVVRPEQPVPPCLDPTEKPLWKKLDESDVPATPENPG